MIRIIKADGEEKQFLAEVEKRAGQVNADVEKTVRAILADVKENGDAAVKSYTAKFDCPSAQYYSPRRGYTGRAHRGERKQPGVRQRNAERR